MAPHHRTSRTQNNDPANMLSRLRHVPFTRPIYDWAQESPEHVQDRLVRDSYVNPEIDVSHSYASSSQYGYPQSYRSTSSMAPQAPRSRISTASDYLPSLLSYDDRNDTITDSSVCTSVAEQIQGYPLLEDINGVLVLPAAEASAPVFECVFWFLSCSYITRNESEWNTHCLSHFRDRALPRSVQCPLCDWSTTCDEGSQAWTYKMQHLAGQHLVFGQTLKTARPDFHLFQHLWQQRLIGDQDLKELKGGNHNLDNPPANFVTTNHRSSQRQRNGGRGLQHISNRRMTTS